jgi:GNAT superfamily N-acetyltransferase
MPPNLLRALAHVGNYAVGLYAVPTEGDPSAERMIGASVGFFAAPDDRSLHSHITGIVGDHRGRGLGRLLKQHQREWALARGVHRITWTFDPLVARNASFNLRVLGARVGEYYVDHYGAMDDGVNRGDESDRIFAVWDLDAPAARRPSATSSPPWRFRRHRTAPPRCPGRSAGLAVPRAGGVPRAHRGRLRGGRVRRARLPLRSLRGGVVSGAAPLPTTGRRTVATTASGRVDPPRRRRVDGDRRAGRVVAASVEWLDAEEALEQRGLAFLAEPWMLERGEGTPVRVRLVEVTPARIVVKVDDYGDMSRPHERSCCRGRCPAAATARPGDPDGFTLSR